MKHGEACCVQRDGAGVWAWCSGRSIVGIVSLRSHTCVCSLGFCVSGRNTASTCRLLTTFPRFPVSYDVKEGQQGLGPVWSRIFYRCMEFRGVRDFKSYTFQLCYFWWIELRLDLKWSVCQTLQVLLCIRYYTGCFCKYSLWIFTTMLRNGCHLRFRNKDTETFPLLPSKQKADMFAPLRDIEPKQWVWLRFGACENHLVISIIDVRGPSLEPGDSNPGHS